MVRVAGVFARTALVAVGLAVGCGGGDSGENAAPSGTSNAGSAGSTAGTGGTTGGKAGSTTAGTGGSSGATAGKAGAGGMAGASGGSAGVGGSQGGAGGASGAGASGAGASGAGASGAGASGAGASGAGASGAGASGAGASGAGAAGAGASGAGSGGAGAGGAGAGGTTAGQAGTGGAGSGGASAGGGGSEPGGAAGAAGTGGSTSGCSVGTVPCDPIANTGCSGACQKCTLAGADSQPTCAAAGTVGLGQSCSRNAPGDDDCIEGVCTEVGVADHDPAASKPHMVCKKPCTTTGECGSGQTCVWGTLKTPPVKAGTFDTPEDGAQFGVCAATCDAFSTSCGSGQSCHGTVTEWPGAPTPAQTLGNSHLACRPDAIPCGSTTCTSTEVCFDASQSHDSPACVALCDAHHACPAGLMCDNNATGATTAAVPACTASNPIADLVDCAGATVAASITITAGGFPPSAVMVPFTSAGAVVAFQNGDSAAHTASSGGAFYTGAWTTGVIQPGAKACIRFNVYSVNTSFFDALVPSHKGVITMCGGVGFGCGADFDCCSNMCDGTGQCL